MNIQAPPFFPAAIREGRGFDGGRESGEGANGP